MKSCQTLQTFPGKAQKMVDKFNLTLWTSDAKAPFVAYRPQNRAYIYQIDAVSSENSFQGFSA